MGRDFSGRFCPTQHVRAACHLLAYRVIAWFVNVRLVRCIHHRCRESRRLTIASTGMRLVTEFNIQNQTSASGAARALAANTQQESRCLRSLIALTVRRRQFGSIRFCTFRCAHCANDSVQSFINTSLRRGRLILTGFVPPTWQGSMSMKWTILTTKKLHRCSSTC